MTLYAKWTINSYTVTFDAGGGGNIPPEKVTYGNTVPQPANPSKPGYTFSGWYSDAAYTTPWDFTSSKVTANMTLYAKWTINSYTVTFNSTGGGSIPPESVTHGNTVPQPANPSKPGHSFAGWHSDAACTSPWDFATDHVTSDITLYAKWTINTYIVIFEANGGDNVSPQTIAYGNTVRQPFPPTKTGHTLAGWYSDAACTTPWDFATGKVTSAMTLYAKWTINTYTVTFNATGGSSVPSENVTHGNTVSQPAATSKPGHSFVGWYRDAAYTTPWDFANGKVTEAMTLYAKWTINRYTVTFNANGGGSVPSQTIAYGNTVTQPTPPAKAGYTFIGWYADASFTTLWNFPSNTVTCDTTLHAKWAENSKKTFTVTFEANGGSGVDKQLVVEGDTVKKPTQPTKTGHIFVGWCSDAACTLLWNFTIDKVTGDVTLYAKWTAITYTVTFATNGGGSVPLQTIAYGNTVTQPTPPAKAGYTFIGWYADANFATLWNFATSTITCDTTLYARWVENSKKTFTVTFEANGGSSVDRQTVVEGDTVKKPSTPTKAGYIFIGWYSNANFATLWNFSTNTVMGDMTLYARWVENSKKTFTVTFEANGGSSVDRQTVVEGDTVKKPTTPTKAGHSFGGWCSDIACTTPWDFTSGKVAGNMTLYAKWTAILYTVTFDANGGDNVSPQTIAYGSTVRQPVPPTKAGHTFIGWYADASFATLWNFSTDVVMGNMTLYAKWVENSKKTFTVTFETNGGTSVDRQTVTEGDTVRKPTPPTKAGHIFVGWCSDVACTTPWNFTTDKVTGNVTLYAKWTAIIYTVTFDANGGSSVPLQKIAYGDTVRQPSNPTKTGYTFVGWYADANFATLWNFATGTVIRDTTLYAKWVENSKKTFTVTFEANGGSSVDRQTVVEGDTVKKPDAPAKVGYTFVGWYSDAACTAPWDFTNGKITGDTTLYAKWTINSYTVAFDANGGGSVPSESVTHGSTVPQPADPTKAGYTFVGWYSDAACATLWNFATCTVTCDTTLYAKWVENSKKTFTVTFEANGGTGVDRQTVVEGDTVKKPAPPTKAGHTFIGWYADANFATLWNFATGTVSRDTTLYAKWVEDSKKTFTVTFDVNGGSGVDRQTVVEGDTVKKPTPPTKVGYTFVEWCSDAACTAPWNFTNGKVTGNMTLYAKWRINRYTVTFDATGGGSVPSESVTHGNTVPQPADPIKTGYAFVGWYSDAACTAPWDFTNGKVTGDTTLYAKWTINSYTVTFETNGGGSIPSESVTHGSTIPQPADPTKAGYTFVGWYSDAACATLWNFAASTVTCDTTLYAKWVENSKKTFTVTFEANGGTGVDKQTVVEGDTVKQPSNPTKAGHTFVGWYADANFATLWNFSTGTVSRDTTLYAKWVEDSKKTFTVTFDVNGGSAVDRQTVVEGDTVKKPSTPTKVGYTFVEWCSDAACTAPWDFTNGKVTGDTTLYARWSINRYTVTFETNGGGSVPSESVAHGSTIPKPANPIKTGYAFVGWYSDAACTAPWDFTNGKVTGDTTLYAKWTINSYTVTFETYGGGSIPSESVTHGSTVPQPADPTKAGYTFVGWYSDAVCTTLWNFATNTVIGDMTLYAKWVENSKKTFTVTFEANGGSSVDRQTVVEGDTVKRPTPPTKTGYTFVGWYADANFATLWNFSTNTVIGDMTL
jgi:uncharacterized repeat protein (TIGR02543 family)